MTMQSIVGLPTPTALIAGVALAISAIATVALFIRDYRRLPEKARREEDEV
jgi:Kef-type K+ transport system membrane component KefB